MRCPISNEQNYTYILCINFIKKVIQEKENSKDTDIKKKIKRT